MQILHFPVALILVKYICCEYVNVSQSTLLKILGYRGVLINLL